MEVYERLDDLVGMVEQARGLPLSDSVVLNRTITLELLDAVREVMPASLRDAATILSDRDDVLDDAQREASDVRSRAQEESDAAIAAAQEEAQAVLEAARADAERMVAEAQADAARTVERARAEAERMVEADAVRLEAERRARVLRDEASSDASRVRAEADIYVDKRLANLEDTLRSALDQVGRGRRRVTAAAGTAEPVGVSGVYDFTADPEVSGDLVGGRRRTRTG